MKKYFSIIIALYLISGNIAAQDGLPINHELWQEMERVIQRNMIPVFTCLKPVPDKLYFSDFLSDTIPNSISAQKKESWLYRKLFKEDLIYVNKDELQFRINPLLDLNLGKEKGSSDLLYRNTRGIRIEGNTSQIITFSSAFYENQAVFPAFIEQKIHDNSVVPGQGLPKVFGKKGKDFAWAEGNLSAKPLKNLILEMGYGKRFFGDGYRSLLLSDYSFVYPYVGYRWCDGNLFMASEVHSYIIPESPLIINSKRFPGKTATLHFLGYQLGHWQISLAETNMYANPDSSGKFHWQAEFFNPFPLINSLAGRGNSMFGLNVRCIPTTLLQLYGQFLMDEYDWNHPGKWQSVKNKTGIQLGVKWFEAFTLSHFYIQAEYNEVRPYTYSSRKPVEAYTHYNEPLAHPLGANFREFLGISNYRIGAWLFEMKLSYALTGKDDSISNWGSDIFKSDLSAQSGYPSYNNRTGQGIKDQIMNGSLYISYILNPASSLNVTLGYQHRSESSSLRKNQTDYFFMSIRTSLINLYYDF